VSERAYASRGGDPARRDRSFLARYGAIIIRGGIAAIPTALYRYQGELDLTPQQVWFVSAILAHKWDAELPYPSLKRLAEQTGVSRQKLHDYQRQLLQAGHLIVINRRTSSGGQDTNYFDFSPLLRRLEEFLERDRPARDTSEEAIASPYVGSGHDNGEGVGRGGVNGHLQSPVNQGLHSPVKARRQPAVTPGLHKEEPFQETGEIGESNKDPGGRIRLASPRSLDEDDERTVDDASSHSAGRQEHGDIIPELGSSRAAVDADERESLDLFVDDLARELGDRAPLRSSGGRLLNLYRRSGLDLDAFVERVQSARRITKERIAQVRGERKPGRPKAAMSYFFAVLEDTLGLRSGSSP
jgi:hypothetical protein